ncbi:MAG: hypothetical protein KUG77_27250, partial [Nannocystaceae bacterium]|nr:hypothetical protein [Nannocystaceae bacterium]
DERWRTAQRLAFCADGDSRPIPARREFERSKLPSWIEGAVKASLQLLPAALRDALSKLLPTEPAVLAALVGGADGVTPGGQGLLAAACREALVNGRDAIIEELLNAGVPSHAGGVSPLIAYLEKSDNEALARRIAGAAPWTRAEAMYIHNRGWNWSDLPA